MVDLFGDLFRGKPLFVTLFESFWWFRPSFTYNYPWVRLYFDILHFFPWKQTLLRLKRGYFMSKYSFMTFWRFGASIWDFKLSSQNTLTTPQITVYRGKVTIWPYFYITLRHFAYATPYQSSTLWNRKHHNSSISLENKAFSYKTTSNTIKLSNLPPYQLSTLLLTKYTPIAVFLGKYR